MNQARLPLAILALVFAACASKPIDQEAPDAGAAQAMPASASPAEEAAKRDATQRKLAVARARLQVAKLGSQSFEEQHAEKMRQARAEHAMAESKLARLVEADAPNRLASEKLDLVTAQDRAQETADELAQIEIMYEDQDLDDLTAEFVVNRGRRNAERASARIKIQEAKLRALEERELPQERKALELAVEKAAAAVKAAEREGEIGRLGKAIGVQEAENAIAQLESELDKSGAQQ